jgi:hypothetical protein
MSKRTHALVLVAIVVAMNLPGMTAIAQAQPSDAVEQFRRGERASQEDGTPGGAVEEFRRGERASQEQPTTDNPTSPTAQVPAPVQPERPTGQRGWLIVSLGLLAAALAVVAGLAVLAARRANRRARLGAAT